jgi:UDP-GlcNAc:undecaprenyl-phosphate GlcNAc-1-phosphate transferase
MISVKFYFLIFLIASLLSYLMTYICRSVAVRFNILDVPHSQIKTHKIPTPYLGGLGVASGFMLSMLYVRLTTQFPDGTLHSLRGIFLGSVFMLILGLVDDIKPKGLHYREKFLLQLVGALCLLLFGVQLDFIKPTWIG